MDDGMPAQAHPGDVPKLPFFLEFDINLVFLLKES